jgi:succinate-semialdehyde dehydrogenase/glutarate-semialdehyde dehydrogenase
MRTLQLFVDGAWRPSVSGEQREVLNPATEEVEARFSAAGPEDLAFAAQAAHDAFAGWSRSSPLERSDILRRTAALLRRDAASLAELITRENGKILAESHAEVAWAAEFLEWFAEEGRRTYGRIVPAKSQGVRQSVVKEAIGPVLALSPWNWPLITAVKKVAAALAAGCTVVLKPAEEAPSAAARLAELLVEAGIPNGVFNVVYGDPALISSTLIAAPEIKKIGFTGSVGVGRALAEQAARLLKPITLELGGHAPVIIFEDADIERAVQKLAPIKFRTSGQVCSSPTRYYVHEAVVGRFTSLMGDAASGLKVGNGLDAGVQMGPPDDARIMSEEPFGPVVPISSFSDYDEVIKRANAVNYGLAGYAFTRSLATARKVSEDLECGCVGVNTPAISTVEAPFGGFKESGGGKEGGQEGIEAFLRTKFVVEDIS